MQRIIGQKGVEILKIFPITHEYLRTPCDYLQFPLRDNEEEAINLMIDTLRYIDNPAYALSANQVGFMKKVFVSALTNINYKKKFNLTEPILKMRKIEVIINPVIELSTETEESEEECLSNQGVFFIYHSYLNQNLYQFFLQQYMYFKRSKSISMKYFDLCGRQYHIQCSGEQAFLYQHECDHLNGVDMMLSALKIQQITP